MMSPVNRFSKISRPARPTARPPTPPMASTELTAPSKQCQALCSAASSNQMQTDVNSISVRVHGA